jgi:hypothetical protein
MTLDEGLNIRGLYHLMEQTVWAELNWQLMNYCIEAGQGRGERVVGQCQEFQSALAGARFISDPPVPDLL